MSKIVEKIKEKEPRNGWWNRVVTWCKDVCISKCINKKGGSHSKYHALTPVNDVDCDVYLDALQEALRNKDIKNIAVTGPYGSGKSSVIRTFFAKRNGKREYKPITITLANFDTNVLNLKGEDETDPAWAKIYGEKLEQLIERSIVQQLFYHEKDEALPESHFKKIHKEKWWKIFLGVIHILLIILSFVILLFSEKFWNLPILKNATEQYQYWTSVAAWLYAIFGGCTIIFIIRKLMLQISAMKFRVENAEIELNKNANKSILNHYIDEIIYFFEETKKNVVILEDIDRFEHYEIFTKLREINYLINNCDKIKHKVVFIYALRDDIFKDTERTKFFDFILPILPIINYSNSGEILRRELPVKPKVEIKDNSVELAEELIDNVSLFIDDLRLIFNIVNEYKIYSGVLSKSKLIANRLFSIIVYKNLYPQDFVELGQNKGLLYDIIREQVKKYQKETIEKYQKQIQEKQLRLKEIESSDRTLSEKELRLVYLCQIINHLSGTFACFVIDNKTKKIHEVAEDSELFEKLITQKKLGYRHLIQNYSGHFVEQPASKDNFSFNEIEKELNPNLTYEQRKALLHKTELDRLKQEIKGLEYNVEECKQWTICDLLNHGILKIEAKKEIQKGEKLYPQKQYDYINIALSNDYINENYWEYISIFHEGSMTPHDKEFVINVKVHRNTPYDHSLNRKDNVFKELTKERGTKLLSEIYALNNDLMDFVLSETGELYVTPYIQAATQDKDFIMQYIERGKNLDRFLNNICIQWPLFWDFICEHKSTEINKYLRLILENVLVDNLVSFFKDEKQHINRFADFMLLNVDEQKKHDIVDGLDLHFEDLNPDTSIDDKRYIYETCAYALRPKVMRVIISAMPNWDERMYNTRNFSYIKEEYPKMFEYIQNNIAEYICNVFLQLEENSDILQEDFVDLLNNENIKDEQKKLIISQCNIKIEGVSVIESVALRSEICRQNKMTATWENVRCILNSQEVNLAEECIAFLNVIENAEQLSEQKLTDELDVLDDSDKTTISYTIIHFADLTIGAYSLLLHAFIGSYSSFEKDTLDEYRMRLLIDNKLVSTNKAAYLYLKGNYNGLHIYLLEKNVAEFKDTYQELKFDANDINIIIQSTAFNNSTKQEIINSISVKEVFAGEEDAINSLVKWLLSDGVHESEALKPEIMNFISQQSFIDISARKKLYLKYSDSISEMVPFLTNLGEPYSLMIGSGDKVVFSKEEADLLKLLRRKGYISKWTHMRTTGRYHVRREHIHI